MASLITHALTYTQEDIQRFFLQPLFEGNTDLTIFADVITDVSADFTLQKFSNVEKISKAEAAGFSGATGATLTQRTITLARIEAEASQSGRDIYGSVAAELLKRGIDKDDITDTLIEQILLTIKGQGIRRDLNRQLWFGDTAAAGDAGGDYTPYDGIFKKLTSLPAGQQLVFPAGALAADASLGEFRKMKAAAPAELIENWQDAVMLVSYSVGQNYRETLQDDGTEAAHMETINGVPTLMWDGLPVIERRDWDVHIAADGSAAGTPIIASDEHRAVLTVRGNIAVGTDYDENVTCETWYNRDEKEYRSRFQYLIGTEYKNDEYTVTDIAA